MPLFPTLVNISHVLAPIYVRKGFWVKRDGDEMR